MYLGDAWVMLDAAEPQPEDSDWTGIRHPIAYRVRRRWWRALQRSEGGWRHDCRRPSRYHVRRAPIRYPRPWRAPLALLHPRSRRQPSRTGATITTPRSQS